mmetsp:Transcript_41972/g.40279  ORF Transcript_41972/g.40279 Transcript_41972/m.40279 type:complete len:135 (+) Transcript_41972:276-680(+)
MKESEMNETEVKGSESLVQVEVYNDQIRENMKEILNHLSNSYSSSQIIDLPLQQAPLPEAKPSLEMGQLIKSEAFMVSGLQFSFRAQNKLFSDFLECKISALIQGFKVRYVLKQKRIVYLISRIRGIEKDVKNY